MRKNGTTLLALSLLIMIGPLWPCSGQSASPSVVTTYEDDFSSNRVRHDSWRHSVVWVEGSFAPPDPYLVHSSQGSTAGELVFRPSGRVPAQLGYCFPIQPDQVVRAIPLELLLELDVRLLAPSVRGSEAGYLQYQVSPDGVDWSPATRVQPTQGLRLPMGGLHDNRYVLFSGANVAIEKLTATTLYRPRFDGDLRVPSRYPTIQSAIDAARTGQRVVVADGNYHAAGPIFFRGKSIVVMSENGPEDCTIDCQGTGFLFVAGETEEAVLDGFTIKNGQGEQGGGIVCSGSSPTISNCIFQDCLAYSGGSSRPGQGGAIYIEGPARPLIQDCQFKGNAANSNSRGGEGGAIYIEKNASATLLRCRFEGNEARGSNSSTNSGGAVFVNTSAAPEQTVLQNCVFHNNFADDHGGAVYLGQCDARIVNCTLVGNRAGKYGGGVYASLNASSDNMVKNSIIWDNLPDNLRDSGAFSWKLEIDHSNVGQGCDENHGVHPDPMFADARNGDFHLLSFAGRWDPEQAQWVHDFESSPCVEDAGVEPVGAERFPHGDLVNLGAYGGTAQASRGYGQLMLHVAKDGDDNNSGQSRMEALATIQAAVILSRDGDVVMVWPGTYREEITYRTRAITIQSAADAAVVSPPAGSDYAFYFHSGEGHDSVLRNMVRVNCPIGGVSITSATPEIHNLTIVNCGIGIHAIENASETKVSNCIFYLNANRDLDGCTADYSCSLNALPGTGNRRADPLFVDVTAGDYHLMSTFGTYLASQGSWFPRPQMSPCIDGGDPEHSPTMEPFSNGGRVNMGAYGGTGQASLSSN